MENIYPFQSLKDYVALNQRFPSKKEWSAVSTSVSFNELSTQLWENYIDQSLEACANDPSFENYSAREKMLALAYTLAEVLREDESIVKLYLDKRYGVLFNAEFFKLFRTKLEDFADALILDGSQTGEIQGRPLLGQYYKYLFVLAINYIIYFWANDTDDKKEPSDVVIDKVINLLFDTIAPNAVDSAFDLAQFLFKRRFNG